MRYVHQRSSYQLLIVARFVSSASEHPSIEKKIELFSLSSTCLVIAKKRKLSEVEWA